MLNLMHRRYIDALGLMDTRLSKLINILKRAERWKNTLLIVTSDHGQAFGENGQLFHQGGPLPHVVRVPLLVRPPGGLKDPGVYEKWIGLSSIATALFAIPGSLSPVEHISEALRGGNYALSAFDGFQRDFRLKFMLSNQEFRSINQVAAAAYHGDLCVVASEGSREFQYYNALSGRPFLSPGSGMGVTPPEAVYQSIEDVIRRLARMSSIASPEDSKEDARIQRRLGAWGYN